MHHAAHSYDATAAVTVPDCRMPAIPSDIDHRIPWSLQGGELPLRSGASFGAALVVAREAGHHILLFSIRQPGEKLTCRAAAENGCDATVV